MKKKLRLLLSVLALFGGWHASYADDLPYQDEYAAATAAISSGTDYVVYTLSNGSSVGDTRYFLTTNGYLTADISNAGIFTFKAEGSNTTLYASGWNLGYKFTNPALTNGGSGDIVPNHHINVGGNNRVDWERQVFFLNSDGDYAIRSTNANSANWGANTYWTVTDYNSDNLPEAEYSLQANFVWKLTEYSVVESEIIASKLAAAKQEYNSVREKALEVLNVSYSNAAAGSTLKDAIDTQDGIVAAATTADEVTPAINALKSAILDFAATAGDIVTSTPIEVTGWIVNSTPTSNASGWTTSPTPNAFDPANNNAEFWNLQDATMKQTLTNLPAGNYKLIAQVLTRSGMVSTLFAGGESMSVVTVDESIVNNRKQAGDWFDAGNGVNELKFTLDAAGDVEIGLTTGNEGDAWTVWRNFTLEYYGTVAPINYTFDYSFDVTDLFITNPSFESGDTNGWNVGSSSDTGVRATNNDTYKMSNSDGAWLFNTWWQGIPITQNLGVLPAGTYELSAIVASDGATIYMTVNDDHSTFVETNAGEAGDGKTITHLFTLDEDAEVVIGIVGGSDGEAGAHKDYTENGYWWYKVDNFKLTYWTNDEDILANEYLKAYENTLAEAKDLAESDATMSEVAAKTLNDVIEQDENLDKTKVKAIIAATEVLKEAVAIANASANNNKIAAEGIVINDKLDNWTSTNSNVFHINTWSTEGNEGNDPTGMTIPFVENWVGKPGPLGTGIVSYTLDGLVEGKYAVSGRVRIYSESGSDPAGAQIFANDETVDISDLDEESFFEFNGMKGLYTTFETTVEVEDNGKVSFGINITAPTFNWVAIKDVKIVAIPKTPDMGTPSFVNVQDGLPVAEEDIAGIGVIAEYSPRVPENYQESALTYTISAQLSNDADEEIVKVVTEAADIEETTITLFEDVAFEVGKTYTVTIVNSTITDGEETWSDDTEYSASFSVVAELLKSGNYIIQNVESGNYLAGANSWGTRSSLTKHGIDWNIAIQNDGTYTLDSQINNGGDSHFLGTNLYVDSSASGWTIEALGNGEFAIKNADGYLAEVSSAVLSETEQVEELTDAAKWKIFTFDDILASCADASINNPVDMTPFIKDANFGRNDQRLSSWVMEASNQNLKGGANDNMCAESWMAAFTLSQVVTGLPAGAYQLIAQAAITDYTNAYDGASYPVVYGNDSSTPFINMEPADRATSMTTLSGSFSAGKYTIEPLLVRVKDDGVLTVGVRGTRTDTWCIWDNFELYYIGYAETAIETEGSSEIKLVNVSNGNEKALEADQEYTNVTRNEIEDGIVLEFSGWDIKNAYNSAFRATAQITNKTNGEIVEVWSNGNSNNIISLAKGYFGPSQEYEVTLTQIEYLDFFRFCDEITDTTDPLYALASAHDGCDPLPLWSAAAGAYTLPLTFTIKTAADVRTGDTSTSTYRIIQRGVNPMTGINSLNSAESNAPVYNLAGQRVDKAQKGIYIVGGKKVLVK